MPVTLGLLAGLELGLALGLVLVLGDVEAGAEDEEDDGELLLLQAAAAATVMHVMPSKAANRLFDDLKGSIPRR